MYMYSLRQDDGWRKQRESNEVEGTRGLRGARKSWLRERYYINENQQKFFVFPNTFRITASGNFSSGRRCAVYCICTFEKNRYRSTSDSIKLAAILRRKEKSKLPPRQSWAVLLCRHQFSAQRLKPYSNLSQKAAPAK